LLNKTRSRVVVDRILICHKRPHDTLARACTGVEIQLFWGRQNPRADPHPLDFDNRSSAKTRDPAAGNSRINTKNGNFCDGWRADL
jgi:hypothetical protein